MLARIYLEGAGVDQDYKKAVEYFTLAATYGDAESLYELGMCHLLGQGVARDEVRAFEHFGVAARKSESSLNYLLKHANEGNAEASYQAGQLFECGEGVKRDFEKAWDYYRKAERLAKAQFALGRLCENRPISCFDNASDIKKCYEDALFWYERAKNQEYNGAAQAIERVTTILQTISAHIKKLGRGPALKGNFLLQKVFAQLHATDLAPDVFYWYAHICEKLSATTSEVIQSAACTLLLELGKFPKQSKLAREVVQLTAVILERDYFCEGPQDPKNEEKRLASLQQLCSDVKLIDHCNKIEDISKRSLRRNDVYVADYRIRLFNSQFKNAEVACADEVFDAAVEGILKLYDECEKAGDITQEMLKDDEWKVLDGSRMKLCSFLNQHRADARSRNRIVRILPILANKLDSKIRASVLATWAAAGHHCATRAQAETYMFYIANVTDAASLDSDNSGLEMRIALCLAKLRRNCLQTQLKCRGALELLHQQAYWEKRLGMTLGLVGDAESYSDIWAWLTVNPVYRFMSDEAMLAEVLHLYAADDMVACIVEEANKLQKSCLPAISITQHFERMPGGLELLAKLYDEDYKLTAEGAKILLYHFGYLD